MNSFISVFDKIQIIIKYDEKVKIKKQKRFKKKKKESRVRNLHNLAAGEN